MHLVKEKLRPHTCFLGPKVPTEMINVFFFHRCLSDVFEGWWHFPFVFPFSIACQVFIALFWDFPVLNCQIRVVNVQLFVTSVFFVEMISTLTSASLDDHPS